jgi:hypothetical protein
MAAFDVLGGGNTMHRFCTLGSRKRNIYGAIARVLIFLGILILGTLLSGF